MTYASTRLHEEIAYVAYHFHWGLDQIIDLEHPTRRRFVEEIAKINRRLAETDEDNNVVLLPRTAIRSVKSVLQASND